MKKLHKSKKTMIIASSVMAVLLVCGTAICLAGGRSKTPPVETQPRVQESGEEVVIDVPSDSPVSVEPIDAAVPDEPMPVEEIEDDGTALKPDETIQKKEESPAPAVKAQVPDTPKEEVVPPTNEPEDDAEAGIQMDGNPPETYSCGCANHHCQNEGFHASLVNRELEGCPYCGSHSCPSFYAVNAWGYTYYEPTLCPQYNVQQDPVNVCSDCGRPMWSPDNPTGCFRYLQDTQCECGEFVPANTCHHHE